jgi:hypothetical protein
VISQCLPIRFLVCVWRLSLAQPIEVAALYSRAATELLPELGCGRVCPCWQCYVIVETAGALLTSMIALDVCVVCLLLSPSRQNAGGPDSTGPLPTSYSALVCKGCFTHGHRGCFTHGQALFIILHFGVGSVRPQGDNKAVQYSLSYTALYILNICKPGPFAKYFHYDSAIQQIFAETMHKDEVAGQETTC